MKKLLMLLLALFMALSAAACAVPVQSTPTAAPVEPPVQTPAQPPEATPEPLSPMVLFTDSAGREVEVPRNITKAAISGPLAQITVFALAPDKLAGVASKWDKAAEHIIAETYYDLPELGQLYGGKGELNLETLLASGAEIVIDVGEPKKTVVEDLDALQQQTGLPFVHITATLDTMGDAYRALGQLLNMPEEAETLAAYCEATYERIKQIAGSVEKANLLYCLGDAGLNVIAKTSYHAEIIDLLSNNLAVVDGPSSKGSGNEIDWEQLLLWNPDVIIFAQGSVFSAVPGDKNWQSINAVKNGKVYEAPFGPYNWMGFPPSAQRYLGMLWMAKLLYPETATYDLFDEVQNYFKLFYHDDLTKEQYDGLVANSIGIQ